ncbi:hypothetical protein DsansV1_C31g0216561 [Dioscorea sansibarensis]
MDPSLLLNNKPKWKIFLFNVSYPHKDLHQGSCIKVRYNFIIVTSKKLHSIIGFSQT